MVDLKINDQVIKGIELVIFDRDGTLINLYTYWGNMVARRAELLCQKYGLGEEDKLNLMSAMGVDNVAHKIKSQGPVGIKKREIVMQTAIDYLQALGVTGGREAAVAAFSETDRWSNDNFPILVKPIIGAYELISQLRAAGCKIAIATTDRTDRAKLTIEHLKWSGEIDLVLGADVVAKPKPAPDMVNMALEKLNVEKDRAVMVGDALMDIEMGVKAGLRAAIAVRTGINTAVELGKLTELVVASVAEIKVVS